MKTRPGEVWLAELGLSAKTRPVVLVSRYDEDSPRALVIYVPLTTQNRNSSYEISNSRWHDLTLKTRYLEISFS